MTFVSPALFAYLCDPTPENRAKLGPQDLAARDTFTGETMKLEPFGAKEKECETQPDGLRRLSSKQ